MPTLVYYSTTGKWCEYTLTAHTTIGRMPDQDLQLLDRMISKSHAEITLESNGAYMIRDVGSRNGTTLNGEPLEGCRRLRDGDEIGMGAHILKFVDRDADRRSASAAVIDPSLSDSQIRNTPQSMTSHGNAFHSSDSCIPGLRSSSHSFRQRISDSRFLPEYEITSLDVLRRDYEKLRVAAELSTEAVGVFELDKLLAIILDKAFQIFNADRGAILLKDPKTGEMTVRTAMTKNRIPITSYKISETLLDEVISEKSAVLSGDALQDTRFSGSQSIVVDNVRSTMCVPLLHDGNVIGVINLDTQITTGAFKEKDLQILTGFARQAALNIQRNQMIEAMRRQAVVHENLRRIISPHLLDDVLSGKIKLEKSGTRCDATVLFADIRGFTHMTEQSSPEEIVALINDFCERMVECIFRHDGALDKFVGDEVMAVWGANVQNQDHAVEAVSCAIDMMSAIKEMNDERVRKGKEKIAIGIGVASGMMIAGYMGSTQAMSFTVIGDTVNLGSRLCSAAQPGEILINSDCWKSVKDRIPSIPLPPMMVKGKQSPIEIYRVETRTTSECEDAFEMYRSSLHPSMNLAKGSWEA